MPSKWTRKVALPIAAAAAASLVALVAPGASAASGTLSFHTARHLAQKLEAKQRRERSLRFTQLGHATRRSSQRIDFDYRDRSTSDVLCDAVIVVVQHSDHRAADIRDAHCHGIPSEILLYEDVTRDLRHAAKKRAAEVRNSLVDYDQSLRACDYIVIPRSRVDEVDVLFDTGATRAFYRPLRGKLDDFDQALHDVNGEDPAMKRGVDAWDRTLVLLDELPAATADPCAAVKQWADDGWSDDTAPADFSKLKVVHHQFRVQEKVLNKAAAHLDDEGVVRHVAQTFAPRGLRKLTTGD
jgi:hypothetical protein